MASSSAQQVYQRVQKLLVASLLYDGAKTNEVLSIVRETDFEDASMAVIVGAISSLARQNETVSAETVASKLQLEGQLAHIGGIKRIFELYALGEKALVRAQPTSYAIAVREMSSKRRVHSILAQKQVDLDDDSGVSTVDVITNIQDTLSHERLRLSDEASVVDVATYMPAYLDALDERKEVSEANRENAEGLQGIPTLIPSLNKYTSGLMPSQLITVGAKSGVGKSVFAIMQTVAAARAGLSVLMVSLEMSHAEIVDRIVANMSGVSLGRLKTGYLNASDRESVARAQKELANMKILIDTDVRATVDSIRSRCIEQAQSDRGLDLLIVDYLQLITPTGKFHSRQEQVADLSRNMKLLAKSLNIPVVVLSQLNRQKPTGGDSEENPLPTMDNIRESAALGQDSDIVILLHRNPTVDNTIPHTLVILEKNRNGRSGVHILCHSNLECSMLREVKREKEVESELDDDYIDQIQVDDDDDEGDFDFTDLGA